jgi:hypothetical protein
MYSFFLVKYRLFLSDLSEPRVFSADVRKKNSNIKFYQNPASGSLVIPGGQYDEANSRFSNFANAHKSSVSLLEKTLSLVTFDILSEITIQGMTPCRFGEKYRRFG